MGRKSVRENKNVYQVSRENAGLTREAAADKLVYISDDRIEKIESGKLMPHPEEVMTMAEVYKNVMLNNYYCSHECPIGQKYVPAIEEKNISQVTLELLNALNTLSSEKDRFLQIMVDGQIQPEEVKDFRRICQEFEKISTSIRALELWVESQEIDTEE